MRETVRVVLLHTGMYIVLGNAMTIFHSINKILLHFGTLKHLYADDVFEKSPSFKLTYFSWVFCQEIIVPFMIFHSEVTIEETVHLLRIGGLRSDNYSGLPPD